MVLFQLLQAPVQTDRLMALAERPALKVLQLLPLIVPEIFMWQMEEIIKYEK